MPPERPLSPPQGQRWPSRAPLPSAPAAAGAPRRRHPPAAGSGTGLGAAGARAPRPARPRPPLSAPPVPSRAPLQPCSRCRGTPASTASRPHRCRSPPSPRGALRPRPAPAPAPRPCAGPAAGTSPAPCLPLLVCNISHYRGGQPENALCPALRPQPQPPVLAAPSGRVPLSAVFLSTRMGEAKGNPKTNREHTQNRRLFICF